MHETPQEVVWNVHVKYQHVMWSSGYTVTVQVVLTKIGYEFSQKLSKNCPKTKESLGRKGLRQLLDEFGGVAKNEFLCRKVNNLHAVNSTKTLKSQKIC